MILPLIPESEVAAKVRQARNLQDDITINTAAAILGNGTKVSAQDTVPFALWCAAQHLDNYQEALWLTVSGLGDRSRYYLRDRWWYCCSLFWCGKYSGYMVVSARGFTKVD